MKLFPHLLKLADSQIYFSQYIYITYIYLYLLHITYSILYNIYLYLYIIHTYTYIPQINKEKTDNPIEKLVKDFSRYFTRYSNCQ